MLSLSAFAEDVQYVPKGGAPRPIRAFIHPPSTPTQERTYDTATVELLEVAVSNAPAAVNSAGEELGGIAEAAIGDGLLRTVAGVEHWLCYVEVIRSTPH